MTEYSEEGGWSTGTEWNQASTWAGGGRRLVSSWSTEEVKSPVIHWDVQSSTTTKAGKSTEGKSEKYSKGDKSTSSGSWPSPASSWKNSDWKNSGWKKGPTMSYGSWPSPASSWKSSGWKGSVAPSICQPAQTVSPAPTPSVATTSCAERKWYYNQDTKQCTNGNDQTAEYTFKECCENNFQGDCEYNDICNTNEVITLPPSDFPTYYPTVTPTLEPTSPPTRKPTSPPTRKPTPEPSVAPVVEVILTPPPSDSPTACPPPTPGVPSMPGCPTPEPSAPPVVEVLPTPPPSFGIDTYSPTFGSTPVSIIFRIKHYLDLAYLTLCVHSSFLSFFFQTVSKETTGPPTSARRTRTFEDVKTDCVNNYDTVVSAESSSTVEVCVHVCTTTKTKYEGGVPVDTEVKTTHAACP